MVVATVELCIDGTGAIRQGVNGEDIREILTHPKSLVWISVERSREKLEELGDALGFHDLAIEDATDENERPKATIFDKHVFILLYDLQRKGKEIVQTPISFFVGSNYLVTVTNERPDALNEVAHRWQSLHDQIGRKNPGVLAYSLIDSIVDGYFPIVDTIGDKLEALETALLDHSSGHPQATIHQLHMELLQLRRIV
ncbi:MAG: CorA family divalent cation transporter, partial [Thermomicrobiales bacterium]